MVTLRRQDLAGMASFPPEVGEPAGRRQRQAQIPSVWGKTYRRSNCLVILSFLFSPPLILSHPSINKNWNKSCIIIR